MKRKILCMVGMIFAVVALCTVSASAMTRDQAVNWAKTQADKGVMYKDSGNGGQCTDFVSAYMNYIEYGDAHYWKNSGGKGFRTYDAKDYFSKSYPSGWQKISNTPDFVPQPGDILCFGANSSNSFGHVAVAIEGCTVSIMKGVGQNGAANNYKGTAAQYQTMQYFGGWGNFQGVIRPKWDSGDTTPPTISNVYASNVSGSSFTVNCTLGDNVGVTRVWLNVYGPSGNKGYAVSASSGAFSHTIKTADYGGAGSYSVHIYAFDAAGNQTGSSISGILAMNDTEKPVITNAYISNISDSSFTVNCTLSDNVRVTRVWLNVYGPSGEKGYEVSASSGAFAHTINTADYGGPGKYSVHIYAFDADKNETGFNLSGFMVASPTTPFTVTTIKNVSAVTNNTSSMQPVTIVIADYSDGSLRNITTEIQTFAPNETKTYSHGANARVFVWDSLTGMKPLAK